MKYYEVWVGKNIMISTPFLDEAKDYAVKKSFKVKKPIIITKYAKNNKIKE